MPVYVFECECGNTLERLVPMHTKTIECENCGKGMKKVISMSSFILKGSGWAFDGYSKGAKKPTNNN